MAAADVEVRFGRGTCCWKPQGCTNVDGCRLLDHPAKRAQRGDLTAPCPNGWVESDGAKTCSLLNGHEPPCIPKQIASS